MFYLALLFRQAITRQVPALFRSFEALIERMVKFRYRNMEGEFEEHLRKFAAGSKPELVKETLVNIEMKTDDADEAI